MKNLKKFLSIFAIAAIISFSLISCGEDTTSDSISPEELLSNGVAELEDGNLDKAIEDFEKSYQADKTNTKATIYSILARLASIAQDDQVKKLIKDQMGIKNYPGKLNDLINPSAWMVEYVKDENLVWDYYDDGWVSWYNADNGWFFTTYSLTPKSGYYKRQGAYPNITYTLVSETPRYESKSLFLPSLDVPSWFGDTNLYKGSFTQGNQLKSYTTFGMLLISNLIHRDTNGLNKLLDGLLSSVFGAKFNEAYDRAETLEADDGVVLSKEILDAFGVSEIFEGEGVYIGKAELKALFASMRVVKASLEWVTAFDWNTDLNFLKHKELYDDYTTPSDYDSANLPLRNNFLKDRGNDMMTTSKASFNIAIEDAIAAYDLWLTNNTLPGVYKHYIKEYKWVKDGLGQLKIAINDGDKFYVTKYAAGTSTYDSTAKTADTLLGIDMGKFFDTASFSIEKLIETEGSGASLAPKFYGFYYSSGTLIAEHITNRADIDDLKYEKLGCKTVPFTDVIIYDGIADYITNNYSNIDYDYDLTQDISVNFIFPQYAGYVKILWDLYH